MVVYLVDKEYPYFEQGDREGWLLVRRLFAEANNRVNFHKIFYCHQRETVSKWFVSVICALDTILSWFAYNTLRYAIYTVLFIIIIIK